MQSVQRNYSYFVQQVKPGNESMQMTVGFQQRKRHQIPSQQGPRERKAVKASS